MLLMGIFWGHRIKVIVTWRSRMMSSKSAWLENFPVCKPNMNTATCVDQMLQASLQLADRHTDRQKGRPKTICPIPDQFPPPYFGKYLSLQFFIRIFLYPHNSFAFQQHRWIIICAYPLKPFLTLLTLSNTQYQIT